MRRTSSRRYWLTALVSLSEAVAPRDRLCSRVCGALARASSTECPTRIFSVDNWNQTRFNPGYPRIEKVSEERLEPTNGLEPLTC